MAPIKDTIVVTPEKLRGFDKMVQIKCQGMLRFRRPDGEFEIVEEDVDTEGVLHTRMGKLEVHSAVAYTAWLKSFGPT